MRMGWRETHGDKDRQRSKGGEVEVFICDKRDLKDIISRVLRSPTRLRVQICCWVRRPPPLAKWRETGRDTGWNRKTKTLSIHRIFTTHAHAYTCVYISIHNIHVYTLHDEGALSCQTARNNKQTLQLCARLPTRNVSFYTHTCVTRASVYMYTNNNARTVNRTLYMTCTSARAQILSVTRKPPLLRIFSFNTYLAVYTVVVENSNSSSLCTKLIYSLYQMLFFFSI